MAIDSVESEPGSSDNRLSLSVSDFPYIKDWKDSKEYTFESVRVRQQTTGEFDVIAAQPSSGESDMEEEEGGEMEGEAPAEATPEEGAATEEAPLEESTPAARLMRRLRG